MRTLLILWAAPLVLFWSWYFVSLNDWNMGYVLLTREAHDLIFRFYADALAQVTEEVWGEAVRIDPAELPKMLARTLVIDSSLLFALVAFRKRRVLAPHLRRALRLARGWTLPGERVEPVEHALEDECGRRGIDALPAFGARHVHGQQPAFGSYRR